MALLNHCCLCCCCLCRLLLQGFDAHRDSHTTADAQCRDTFLCATLVERVDERDKDARTGAADGMAECDGATVHIHLELRTIVNVFITRDISKEPATLLNFLPSFSSTSFSSLFLPVSSCSSCCSLFLLHPLCNFSLPTPFFSYPSVRLSILPSPSPASLLSSCLVFSSSSAPPSAVQFLQLSSYIGILYR